MNSMGARARLGYGDMTLSNVCSAHGNLAPAVLCDVRCRLGLCEWLLCVLCHVSTASVVFRTCGRRTPWQSVVTARIPSFFRWTAHNGTRAPADKGSFLSLSLTYAAFIIKIDRSIIYFLLSFYLTTQKNTIQTHGSIKSAHNYFVIISGHNNTCETASRFPKVSLLYLR